MSLLCVIFGHRWTGWYAGSYASPCELCREGYENRVCRRCQASDVRPAPEIVQSRPDGFHLERIPVHEDDGQVPELPAEPDRVDEQIAALRHAIGSLGIQLEDVKEDRDQIAAVARQREEVVRTLVGQLASARRVLESYGADLALIYTLNPSEEAAKIAALRPVGI